MVSPVGALKKNEGVRLSVISPCATATGPGCTDTKNVSVVAHAFRKHCVKLRNPHCARSDFGGMERPTSSRRKNFHGRRWVRTTTENSKRKLPRRSISFMWACHGASAANPGRQRHGTINLRAAGYRVPRARHDSIIKRATGCD